MSEIVLTERMLEQAAYLSAHAIMAAELNSPQLACAGARRSFTIDAIAGIIGQVFAAARTGER